MLQNNFTKLPLKQKIQLYFIVVVILGISFILLQNYISTLKTIKTPKLKEYTIKSIKDKITVESSENIMRHIEDELDKETIFIKSIKTTNRTIILEIKDSFRKIIGALDRLEHYLIIEEFTLEKDKIDNSIIKCRVVFLNNYYINQNKKYEQHKTIKEKEKKEQTKPIIKDNTKVLKTQKEPINIVAIINNEVFIKNKWYKKGEIFEDYQIIDIKSSLIKLKDNISDKTITIRLKNE